MAAGLPITVVLINYTRLGAPFTNQLTLEPLCLGPDSPGRITHYVGTLRASPCCETLSVEPQLSTRFECMDMGGCTPTKAGDLSSGQPLPCRQLVEGLIAANGDTPVSLPQLVRSPSIRALPPRVLFPFAPLPAPPCVSARTRCRPLPHHALSSLSSRRWPTCSLSRWPTRWSNWSAP